MVYSRVYKNHYPIQHGVDLAMLEEKERERMAKCIRKFPRLLTAWYIEVLRHRDIKKLGQYNIGDELEVLKGESASIADKVMLGRVLNDKEVRNVNLALCADKYNWLFSALIPPITHLERIYSMAKQRRTGGQRDRV